VDEEYTFELSVTDDKGTGTASITLTVIKPPFIGSFSIEPTSGFSDTWYTITAHDCKN